MNPLACRHCGSPLRRPFLDLGSAPPANAYLSASALHAPQTWYPLRLLVCENCWLVQTQDQAARETLFTGDYAYFSAFSSTWRAHAKASVHALHQRLGLHAGSRVVEIACNDGCLLQYVQAAGIPCYGVEPTASTAAAARARGIEVVERFFGLALAQELAAAGRQADLVIANNVLAHVPDINDFVAGAARLLKPHGVASFEFPQLLRMVQGCQFDTAYHEHYSYLSLTAVQRIFAACGLALHDVQELPTHGGSLRVLAARADVADHPQASAQGAARVARQLSAERQAGLCAPGFYGALQAQALRIKNDLLGFLLHCRAQGISVGAYGAAAKGNTLLNFAGVRPDLLPYVADRNPAKQGKFLPGSHIPVVDEEYLRTQRPQRVLILPWNLREELTRQLGCVRAWGGRFVLAVPRLEVL
ncbi:methyltransferase domain-containing protein [Verminephrobacter aporrectodeae subsp. tuberculatae]|uniref:Methyltransferase domain-containing protein n=2 Tax=Verminephrobacter TaxID=364316 RepID=A0ABT3KT11_9BURK|nr:class I SAM-dependent methyltransferase [Verminephrobacter aporrectodeae]MCW5321467.1 methyltransferase domain-containing protein [Verminephrobacter aporrectodeae subsp. tuberculatae]MCW8197917.1 methyltransferase domain-containing protein [Verminephrobacter aporrectodeae subsp. tuberculatae]